MSTGEPTPPGATGKRPGWIARLGTWFESRTGANQALRSSLDEAIPGGARFAYVFGSALLFLFASQLITGLCLALYYVPSPLTAHVTAAYIVKEVAGGAFLRSLHSYGSSAMVVVLVLHMLQTLVYGSYKGRRELLWISGGILSLLVLAMTFTGYLLPWDLRAYFAGGVGTSLIGELPLVGDALLRFVRGGATMGALTLSRFYMLHVFLLPAMIASFIAAHVLLFRKAGAAGPMDEDPVEPHLPTGKFYPAQVIIDMAFALVLMGILGTLAHFVPVKLGPVADPSNSNYLPRPEWYYLPFFEWLKFWEGRTTIIGVFIIPGVLAGLFFALPFLDRGRERRPWKRVLPVGGVLIVLLGLLWLGLQSRRDDSRDATTAAQIAQQDLEEDRYFHAAFVPDSPSAPRDMAGTPDGPGKAIFAAHGCIGCHGVGGAGGTAPSLTHISDRFQPEQLGALVKDPNEKMKAGGMGPLQISDADLASLVSYLEGLGGTSPGRAPAASAPAASLTAASPPAAAPGRPAVLGATAPTATPPIAEAARRPTPGPLKSGLGQQQFAQRGCTGCHGAGGEGTDHGPALTAIGKTLSAAQITDLLQKPNAKMTAGGMAPFAGTQEELSALVSYLRGLQSSSPQEVPAHAGVAPARAPKAPVAAPVPLAAQPAAEKLAAAQPAVQESAAPSPEPAPVPRAEGEAVFTRQGCAACHGEGGVGTSRAPALAAIVKPMAPEALASLLEDPNSKMKAGGMSATRLPAAEMAALVSYIKGLGDRVAAPAPATNSSAAANPQAASESKVDSPAHALPLTERETAGQQIFRSRHCGECHGVDGVRGTSAAPALAGTGRAFPPQVLTAMFLKPTAPMREGGMPPVSATREELDALADYVSHIGAPK